MRDEYYVGIRERLRKLLARGVKLADQDSNTPGTVIVAWMEEVDQCLVDGGAALQAQQFAFRDVREACVFRVEEDMLNYKISETETAVRQDIDSVSVSGSAYRPSGADSLFDFRFERLQKINAILRSADLILRGVGLPIGSGVNETLGEELRAVRKYAGHSQREAAEKIGYDHKYISDWETGKSIPSPKAAKNIRDYIRKHSETGQ